MGGICSLDSPLPVHYQYTYESYTAKWCKSVSHMCIFKFQSCLLTDLESIHALDPQFATTLELWFVFQATDIISDGVGGPVQHRLSRVWFGACSGTFCLNLLPEPAPGFSLLPSLNLKVQLKFRCEPGAPGTESKVLIHLNFTNKSRKNLNFFL
jgi:hypothetical protein